MNRIKIQLLIFLCIISLVDTAASAEYRAVVKDLPAAEHYASLIKAIAEITGNSISVQIVPSARSEYLLINGKADLSIPQLKPVNDKYVTEFCFASISLCKIPVILYSNKNKIISTKSVYNDNSLIIETDPGLTNFFNIRCNPSNSLEHSFERLSKNRIDAFIMTQISGDSLLKKMGYKNIYRLHLLDTFITIAIRKGTAGGKLDKIIVEGFNKLKTNGKYEQIMGTVLKSARFNDWQP